MTRILISRLCGGRRLGGWQAAMLLPTEVVGCGDLWWWVAVMRTDSRVMVWQDLWWWFTNGSSAVVVYSVGGSRKKEQVNTTVMRTKLRRRWRELRWQRAIVTASSGSGPDIQKKVKRAERFGVPVQFFEEEKRSSRAER
ncbi:hypothetical protein Droror1_Dr00000312 [Drosera rotundifolia]